MDVKGLGHVVLFGCVQKLDQAFNGCVLMMMTAAAGIGLFLKTARLQAALEEHESEGVTVCVPGLADPGDSWHMTADTAPKGMDSVGRAVLGCRMTALAEFILKQPGLGTDDDQWVGHFSGGFQRTLASVDVVAGDAGHPHFGMFTFFPVEILLIAVSRFPTGPEAIRVSLGS